MTRFLLDGHVGRVLERVLGERTTDVELLAWCAENDRVLLTNNAKDFEPLHPETKHAGLLVYRDRGCRTTIRRLARTVDEVLSQHGAGGIENELVDLGE